MPVKITQVEEGTVMNRSTRVKNFLSAHKKEAYSLDEILKELDIPKKKRQNLGATLSHLVASGDVGKGVYKDKAHYYWKGEAKPDKGKSVKGE